MYKFLLVSLCILVAGCNSDKVIPQDNVAKLNMPIPTPIPEGMRTYGPIPHPHPYDMQMQISALEEGVYDFEVSMKLFNGAHYISPNAVREFSGKFTIELDDTDKLEYIDGLVETPRSVEEIDPHPFTNGTVNWVREDTKYNQKIKPTVDADFEVKGFIQFTIEPRCTLEKLPIIIKHKDGDLRVEPFGC